MELENIVLNQADPERQKTNVLSYLCILAPKCFDLKQGPEVVVVAYNIMQKTIMDSKAEKIKIEKQ